MPEKGLNRPVLKSGARVLRRRGQPSPEAGAGPALKSRPVEVVRRVALQHNYRRKTLLFVEAPFPELGDRLTIDEQDWTVTKIKDERVLFKFKRDGLKLRQVFA